MSEDDRSGPSARQKQGDYPRRDFFHTDYVPTPPHVANPSPLGLGAFGVTAFVLSCFNANFTVAGGSPPSIEIGLAFFYGGICQILAGQWEFKAGHTFEATVFTSYGGFWISFGVIMVLGKRT
jgi:succinate-acetate transporter protein